MKFVVMLIVLSVICFFGGICFAKKCLELLGKMVIEMRKYNLGKDN